MSSFFFFNDTATTEIYTLSLHDALPIYFRSHAPASAGPGRFGDRQRPRAVGQRRGVRSGQQRRSEEHTSELQSRLHLVCRLLLEKKKESDITSSRLGPLPTTDRWSDRPP